MSTSRTMAQKAMSGASTVSQAMQSFQYTRQAARDTGSTPEEAKKAGAMEAFKTVMTGSRPGGSRSAGERMYSDHQRGQQFADVRNSPNSPDTMAAPKSTGNKK